MSPDMMELVTKVGFPIAVAAFVLVRIEPRLTDLTKAINGMAEVLAALKERIG